MAQWEMFIPPTVCHTILQGRKSASILFIRVGPKMVEWTKYIIIECIITTGKVIDSYNSLEMFNYYAERVGRLFDCEYSTEYFNYSGGIDRID